MHESIHRLFCFSIVAQNALLRIHAVPFQTLLFLSAIEYRAMIAHLEESKLIAVTMMY